MADPDPNLILCASGDVVSVGASADAAAITISVDDADKTVVPTASLTPSETRQLVAVLLRALSGIPNGR